VKQARLPSAVLPALLLLMAWGCEPTGAPDPVQAPEIRFTTDEAFDPASVPAYEGDHPEVYAYIDANQERHLENLRRWLSQPSISAQDVGIRDMAEMVRGDLAGMGFREADLVPTDGHPGVWGYYDAGADRTLMVYMMYDVQPVNEAEWRSPPFEARIVETELGEVLMARGATNQKGPQRAFLNALEAIIAVHGSLPVNLMITAEGEEELGSPHYHQIVGRYEDRLRTADGVFFPFNSQNRAGEVGMPLGVKGILYTEMEARGGPHGGPTRAEIHGSYKALVDAPAWRLVQALASLTTPDGNTIAVPGYYDPVRSPTPEEERLMNHMLATWSDEELQGIFGVERWIDGITGRDAVARLLYHPTLNINGMWSGYTGEGVMTILPHRATAKVDSRLPPGHHPDTAVAMIRRHLDDRGFDDVEIRVLSGYPPANTSVEEDVVQATLGVFRKRGLEPRVSPWLGGSAPFYEFSDRLGLPLAFAGLGHGSGAHAPNEYMVIRPAEGSGIAGLAEIEKAYVDILFALAGR
jgi:acetylornithine deacetylase/succinyl-diaminopimelate desuccinylase-like protein